MTTALQIWEGPEVLRPFLVPVADLEPFPGNPRLGSVDDVAASFRQFGQLKPIVVDGHRIVAGHHMVRAARECGWTHIAAVDHRFADENQQRAFLLADNRTSDLGTYDIRALVSQLQTLHDVDALTGTGYTPGDLDGYLAELSKLNEGVEAPQSRSVTFEASVPPAAPVKRVTLEFNEAQHKRFERMLRIVAREKAVEGLSASVMAAVEVAAHHLNQGA